MSQFTLICYGVLKTLRSSEPAHIRSIMNSFVDTKGIRPIWVTIERSYLFIFQVTCNLVRNFGDSMLESVNLGSKYGADFIQVKIMDNVEEFHNHNWEGNKTDLETEM